MTETAEDRAKRILEEIEKEKDEDEKLPIKVTPELIKRIRNGEEIEINIPPNAPEDRLKTPFRKKPN